MTDREQTFGESPMQTSHLAPKVKSALDAAYDDLLWISEYPNRNPNADEQALALAEYARSSLARIERAEA